MLRTSDSDTEIVLGNKQLLGIFFVVAILLGAAFTGGYMVGKGPAARTAAAPSAGAEAPGQTIPGQTSPAPAIGETHSMPADSGESGSAAHQVSTAPVEEPPLGSPEWKKFQKAQTADAKTPPPTEAFVPQSGQTFLQVVAVSRDEAEGIADVLRKKHFRAHAVPKPGNPRLYRVLVGPVTDAADLSTTREALRKTGFAEVIVQKY